MIKFTLVANQQSEEGFKVSFQADGQEERETIEKIMGELIAKIKTIEVKIGGEENNY